MNLLLNPFLQMAFIAGFFISIASGIVGSFVVIRKISSLCGSISHAILGGVGLFYFLEHRYQISWADPFLGALIFAILSAFLMGWAHLYFRQREDSIISAIWAIGMAIGIIFFSLVPGYNSEFSSFLFGNILLITKTHLIFLGSIDLILILVVWRYFHHLTLVCFDEEQAKLQKISVNSFYFLLLTLISLSIVVLMYVIGIILVIALFTLPPTISLLISSRLKIVIILSILFSMFFCFFGIILAYLFDFPPGATISILSALGYLVFLGYKKRKKIFKITY